MPLSSLKTPDFEDDKGGLYFHQKILWKILEESVIKWKILLTFVTKA